jgi:cyclic pyranopterin phosphate synthase
LTDNYGRPMRDLRISITDRCNFRCFYCKSVTLKGSKERAEILTFEEIVRLARVFVGLGITKIRVTGGEPMVRRDVDGLIAELSRLPGLQDLALTTNGFNLAEKAALLKSNGLKRVTVSLDSLNPERFALMTQSRDFEKVLAGIHEAKRVGLEPVKVNCVLVRGFNEDDIIPFADIPVRFIEFMPLDQDEGWNREKVITGAEALARLRERFDLVPAGKANSHATSADYRFADSPGGIGLIMPVSVPFCGQCSRIRLTADGKIRTCLFSVIEHEIRSLLRSGADDSALVEFIVDTVEKKERGHRINEPGFVPPPRSMSFIGG